MAGRPVAAGHPDAPRASSAGSSRTTLAGMTPPNPLPPLAPDELVSTWRSPLVLETFLDLYRDILKRKLAGLSDEQIRQRHVRSQTTLGGLAKHLTAVEREWFQAVLAGRSEDELGPRPPGDGWTLNSSDTAETLLAGYEQACAGSRRAAAGLPLDHRVPHPRLGHVSLRWIYVHMIEESARHAGHADILREQTDGATGFDG